MATHRTGLVSQWFTRQATRSQRPCSRRQSAKSRKNRGLRFESLEARSMLAVDMAAIGGLVSVDIGGVDEPVAGVVLALRRDNGNGVFDPPDVIIGTATTDADGVYRFDNVPAGNYFVRQRPFVVGSASVPGKASDMITVSPADAEGTMYTLIDSFDTTQQVARATGGTPNAASVAVATEAIGGFRKLVATLDQPFGTVAMAANDPGSGLARLDFSATATATGSRLVTWDGSGTSPGSTHFTGLGGIDLTEGGLNTGISIVVNADKAGVITTRLYTSASNYSTAAIAFPATGSGVSTIFMPFSSFTATAGAGVTLTNLGAIQIDIDASGVAADGYIDSIGGFGPTLGIVDFMNDTLDLAIMKTVSSASPQLNSQVTFQVTVTNQGSLDGTGVQVRDALPAGLSYVSATATRGAYNPTTGLWNVGAIAQGTSETLTLVATVTSIGVKTNTAQVWAANQSDIDSSPANSTASEDDQASVSLTPVAVDLAVTKTVNDTTPDVGQDVTFTIVVRNDGPSAATGVQVLDQLPAGLTFSSATPTTGTTYNSTTGIWTVGTLASGGSMTLTMIATVTAPGTKSNTAQVWRANQADIDSTPGNGLGAEDDQATVSITPNVVDLALTKSVDTSTPLVNQSVTFTIVVGNSGPNTATGVTVLDLLPLGLSFQSSTSTLGSYNASTGIWTVGSLTSGQSATLTITVRVTTPGLKINTAQIASVNEYDIDSTPGNNNAAEDDQASANVIPRLAATVTPPTAGRFNKQRFLAR